MKNIIIYDSHFELMNSLTDEQAGILIKAVGLFRLGQEPTITDSLVLGIFMAIKRDFVIQSENYQKVGNPFIFHTLHGPIANRFQQFKNQPRIADPVELRRTQSQDTCFYDPPRNESDALERND